MRSPAGTPARPRLPARSGPVAGFVRTHGHRSRGPPVTRLAAWSVFNPRIGRSRAFNLPWSASHRLFSYCPVLPNAAGINSSITFPRAAARSVMTSVGVRCALSGAVKNLRAEAISSPPMTQTHLHVIRQRVAQQHVAPDAVDLHLGLAGKPSVAGGMPARAGRVDQLQREPLDPPVPGDVIYVDTALGEEFLQVPAGKSVLQGPSGRQQEHARWGN